MEDDLTIVPREKFSMDCDWQLVSLGWYGDRHSFQWAALNERPDVVERIEADAYYLRAPWQLVRRQSDYV